LNGRAGSVVEHQPTRVGVACPTVATGETRRRSSSRRGRFGLIGLLWRVRWNLVRLCVAVFLLWIVASDTGARLARLQLASLPDFDYVSEIRHLRQAGRYGEAAMVADAGLASASGANQHRILDERQKIDAERGSAMRRLRDVGLGALTGSAGLSGEASLERLGGALAADLLVVGDIRDLMIQASKYMVDGEVDEVIVALSGLGLVTTVAPEVDWAPALLKIAKKAGTLSRRMQEFIVGAVKSKRVKELEALKTDVKVLAEHASPAGAIRLMGYVDEPGDAARLARFMERNAKDSRGAFALHVAGGEGAGYLKRAEAIGPLALRTADDTLVKAARKGPAGIAWLRTKAAGTLLKPHPIIGLTKGLWKGNVELFARAAIDRIGPSAWWLVPLLAAWVFVECMLLGRKAVRAPVTG